MEVVNEGVEGARRREAFHKQEVDINFVEEGEVHLVGVVVVAAEEVVGHVHHIMGSHLLEGRPVVPWCENDCRLLGQGQRLALAMKLA